jgi:phosphate transporter
LLTGVTSDSIYTLEQRVNQQAAHSADAESSPLLNGQPEDPDKAFTDALNAELEKVHSFYQLKELEIYGELEEVLEDSEHYEEEQDTLGNELADAPSGRTQRNMSVFKNIGFSRNGRASTASKSSHLDDEDGDSDEDDANETSRLQKRSKSKSPDGHRRRRTWSRGNDDMHASTDFASSRRRASAAFEDYNDMAFSALFDEGISLKKRAATIYVTLCELRSFIQLNKTGFSKVLKKYDKILDRELKTSYLAQHVDQAYPFQQSTMDKLADKVAGVEEAYSRICTKGDVAEAKRELRLHLREHVVWERNTVWREMIGIERKAQAANLGVGQLLGRKMDPRNVRLQGDEDEPDTKEVETPIGRYRCPRWLLSTTFWSFVVIIAIFMVLLLVPIMKKPEQQNCLALVVFVSLLWATEVCLSLSKSDSRSRDTGHPALRYVLARAIPGCHSSRCKE